MSDWTMLWSYYLCQKNHQGIVWIFLFPCSLSYIGGRACNFDLIDKHILAVLAYGRNDYSLLGCWSKLHLKVILWKFYLGQLLDFQVEYKYHCLEIKLDSRRIDNMHLCDICSIIYHQPITICDHLPLHGLPKI